jgi:ACS family hexuronate transporter-like MFS transporter
LGIGEAGLLPATVKTVAEWFPKSERALAVGMTNVGIGVGSMIAAPFVTWLILRHNWRIAFLVCGAAGFAWLLLWLLVYHEPGAADLSDQEGHRETAVNALGTLGKKAEPTTEEFSWTRLVRLPQVWGLMAARFLADPVWYFHLYWLPPYLSEARGLNLKQIGAYGWIPYAAVVVGNVVGGLLPGYLLRKGFSLTLTRKGMAAGAAFLMPVTIMAARVDTPGAAIGLIALAVLLAWIWATTLFTLPADLFPPNLVGSVYGLSGFAGSLGAVVFMPVVGWVVDHFSYTPMFTLVGLLHPTAAIIILVTIPRVTALNIRMRTS